MSTSQIQTPSKSPTPPSPIRVLLVDDSPLVLTILKRMLATSPGIEVVGTANNGKEALALLPRLQPDVICADYHMPVMDGLEFTRTVMAQDPRPILILSVSVQPHQAENIFAMLEAGAIDILAKPRSGPEAEIQAVMPALIEKIKILAGVVVFRKRRHLPPVPAPGAPSAEIGRPALPVRIVVMGASTGGPQALQTILTALPADFPVPILCVQHIAQGFLRNMVDWLCAKCRLPVLAAETGVKPAPGMVYFAPENNHLSLDADGRFLCTNAAPYKEQRPSISVTMLSVAQHYGATTAAVLLTGMGDDGTEGMTAVFQAGGVTIAQDEDTSVIFGMPKQAIDVGVVQHVLPVDRIAAALLGIVNHGGRRNGEGVR